MRAEWDEADAQWRALNALRKTAELGPATRAAAELYLVDGEFLRHRLEESMLRHAEQYAIAYRNRWMLARLHLLRGEWKANEGDWHAAARSLSEAVRMKREVAMRDVYAETLLALAKFRLGQLAEPHQQTEELSQVGEPVHHVLAELWLAQGDDNRARHHALAAYHRAWADGAPYVRRYVLDRATALLEQLGTEVPALPPYDPSNAERLPFEDLVVGYIATLRAEAANRVPTP